MQHLVFMNKERKILLEWVFIFVFLFIVGFIFINRLFYGVETSDEAFYVVTGYRMLQGNIPYGDMWEVNAADAYFMFPFLLIRSFVFQGTEGIHLFLRLAFFLLSTVGMWAVYMFAKEAIKKEYAFLLGTVILFFAPFQLYNFSYNNLAALFVSASICMMLISFNKEEKLYQFLSGVFMALGVVAYPTMVLCYVFLAVVAIVRKFSICGARLIVWYTLGGIAVAIPIIIHLSVTTGMAEVINNLRCILAAGSTPGLAYSRLLMTIFAAIKYLVTPFITNGKVFCLYVALIVLLSLSKKTRRISKYLMVLYPVICALCSARSGVHTVMKFVFPVALVGPLAVLLSSNKKSMLKKVVLEWGLSMIVYFVIAFSSGGGVANARAGLIFAAIVSIKLIIEAIQDESPLKYEVFCIYGLIMTLVLGEVLLFYEGIFRDKPYSKLTEKVESGVYRGIYTTPGRKRHIEDLQSVMSQIEDKGESVMILYHSCYAYLMVDMIPKIPSTWGCTNYRVYGYDNQQLFMEYLKRGDNIPENIITIDIPKKYDYAGQRVESYIPYYPKLNEFIESHYTYAGEYEHGESGTVKKYEVDWGTF